MDQFGRIEGDLQFVRAALESSNRSRSPTAIYFLWAVIVLIGFALIDFRPSLEPVYWALAAPAGFLASVYMGWRHARRAGQLSASEGNRHVFHWGGVLVAVSLAILMPWRGDLPWDSLDAVILLILALGYFTAGVHIDRPLMGVGAVMGIGYVIVLFASAYTWTIVGVAIAVALTIAGIRGGRLREAAR